MKKFNKIITNPTVIVFIISFIANCILFLNFSLDCSFLECICGFALSTLTGGFFITAFYDIVILSIIDSIKTQKNNKKYIKEHGLKLRLRCLDCKYCKWFYYHPFYKYGKYGNVMVHKLPEYCHRIKKQLKPDVYLRCQISKAELAMWESNKRDPEK